MTFILGLVCGLIIDLLLFITIIYYRSGIEKGINIVQRQTETTISKRRGAIFLPDDENEILRQEVIKKNSAQGRDTPIDELR